VCGAVPLESVLAVESETMLETEVLTGETQTEEMQAGETLQEPETEPVETDPGKEEPETAVSAETETESNTDMGKYTNSISGVLWVDANEDGTYDSSEQALADYPVYLYVEGDTDNAVITAATDADGRYLFEEMTPGRYVVGIKAEENGTEYLLPLMGVQNDNKFYFTPDYSKVISNPIDIAADTVVEDIDAAMRTTPQIQPMAAYTINLASPAAVTGVTYASNVLTFTTAANGNTYTITGTTTTVRIVVQTNVTVDITLSGASMTNSTYSPFQLQGTANVTLTLADGTTNTLTCSATTDTQLPHAGLTVPNVATLTIKGTGVLNASGGFHSAGIGGYAWGTSSTSYGGDDGGTIIINSGTVTATSIYGAGIGGGNPANGVGPLNAIGRGGGCKEIIITGGTITATSSSCSGIGGGYAGITDNITITGGTIIASSSGNGCPGIGDPSHIAVTETGVTGTIAISGGVVSATGGQHGAGIGGAIPGEITISGGTVTATATASSYAGYRAAGIGYCGSATTPPTSVVGGPITITGGRVTATSSDTDSPGIGSNSKTYDPGCSVIFTGGSIYPTDSAGTVSVYPTPTNGNANGNDPVGMLTFTRFAGQEFTINTAGTAGAYMYKGLGHTAAAYPWLVYPGVSTEAATNVTANSATLNGTYYMNGTTISSAYFEYGTSTGYGSTKTLTTPTNVTSGNIESVLDNLTGLSSNTTYHYRLVITVGSITVPGNDMTFTTEPVVDTLTAAPTGSSTATISGTIAAGNANISDVIITYAIDAGFTANIVTLDGSSGVTFTNTTYTADITGLTSGQTYYVKVEAVGPGGTSDAKTGSFVAGAYPVTEKFVDLSGNPVDPIGLPNNTLYVAGSYTASGIPPSHTVGSNTYEYVGYKLDSYTSGDAFTSGTPSSVTITGSRDVYYVYSNLADLTISKTVTSAYADLTKAFTFTVYFQDSSGTPLAGGTQFTYTGGASPSGGTLTLDGEGKATFTLSHGQMVTIAGVSTSGRVRIVETADTNYTTSFKDSLDAGSTSGSDTGVRPMTAANRTFNFTNARNAVVPTGSSTGSSALIWLPVLALLAIMAGSAIKAVYRRREGRS